MHVSCTIELPNDQKRLIQSETEQLRQDHAEFHWKPLHDLKIDIVQFPHVEDDLIDSLVQKLEQLTVDVKPFQLFAHEYRVKIAHVIDIQLAFQHLGAYTQMHSMIHGFFHSQPSSHMDPVIQIARYKIPSKQQYKHLKNTLEKCATNVECLVNELVIHKVTFFGKEEQVRQELGRVVLSP
jgi:hypothetical protein